MKILNHFTFSIKAILPAMALACATQSATAQINELPRVTPESVGISSKVIANYFDSVMSLKDTEIHSVLLMRHGKVIGEIHPAPFKAEYGHTLFSASKTFTSAAIGIAIKENLLRIDDRLATFFPDLLPEKVSSRLAAITIRDLLTMNSGFNQTDDVRNNETEWVKKYLAIDVVAEPGTKFKYDSMDTYLLAAIIQKVTGQTVFDYLKQRMFEPLHITEANWETSPEGINCGGWGLYLQSESLAKFGQLLLNKGSWQGKEIIPASWVEEMMKPHVSKTGGDSYCYQMWKCDNPNTARADGAYGQYVIVMPNEDMVAVVTQVITKGNAGKREQHMLFKNVLSAIKDGALTKSAADFKRLQKKSASYVLPYAEGKSAATSKAVFNKTFTLDKNANGWKSVRIVKDGKNIKLVIDTEECGTNEIECGYRKWTLSEVATKFPSNARGDTKGAFSGFTSPFKASASYGWTNDGKLNVKIHYVDWMSSVKLQFDFAKNQMTLQENYKSKASLLRFK